MGETKYKKMVKTNLSVHMSGPGILWSIDTGIWFLLEHSSLHSYKAHRHKDLAFFARVELLLYIRHSPYIPVNLDEIVQLSLGSRQAIKLMKNIRIKFVEVIGKKDSAGHLKHYCVKEPYITLTILDLCNCGNLMF